MKKQVLALANQCKANGYSVYVGRSSVGISGKPRVDFKTAISQMREILANE